MNKKVAQTVVYDEYSFGKYIRRRREELGLSCRELARMMQISAAYLCDIENGHRRAPLKARNGKDYMKDFVRCLQIVEEEEIVFFYELAVATRGLYSDVFEYLKSNKYALKALRLAKEVGLSDEEWQNFISNISKVKE